MPVILAFAVPSVMSPFFLRKIRLVVQSWVRAVSHCSPYRLAIANSSV